MKPRIVDLANTEVRISQVCEWLDVYVPDFLEGRSRKLMCPFSNIYHLGLGTGEKSFRIFPDTNTAFCFDICGSFTPVSLYAKYNGIPYKDAAFDILDKVGYKFPSLEEKWQSALNSEQELDIHALGLALKVECERVAGISWNIAQLDDKVSGALDKCLSILDLVGTEDEADKWLTISKEHMRKVLWESRQ